MGRRAAAVAAGVAVDRATETALAGGAAERVRAVLIVHRGTIHPDDGLQWWLDAERPGVLYAIGIRWSPWTRATTS